VLGFGSLFFFVVQLPIGMPTDLPSTAWLLFVLLALGPTLLSFALYTIGLGYLPPSRAAITATVEPVAAAIFAFLLLHEALEPWQIVGMILVLSGVVIVRLCREGQ
jgi:drug/metabolite transporter (DMT)-like permease